MVLWRQLSPKYPGSLITIKEINMTIISIEENDKENTFPDDPSTHFLLEQNTCTNDP